MDHKLKATIDQLTIDEQFELGEYLDLVSNRSCLIETEAGLNMAEWTYEAYSCFVGGFKWDHSVRYFRNGRLKRYTSNCSSRLVIDYYWLEAHPDIKAKE